MPTPEVIFYDTETDGLFRHQGDEMFSFSTCDEYGNAAMYDLDKPAPRGRRKKGWRVLRELFDDRRAHLIEIGCHNARFDLGMTEDKLGRKLRFYKRKGRRFERRVHESMACSHLMQNNAPGHGLDHVAYDLFGFPKGADRKVAPFMDRGHGLRDCPYSRRKKYQMNDSKRSALIKIFLLPKIKKEGMLECYDMECRLVWTTLAIENRGMMIDEKACLSLIRELRQKRATALADFRDLAGEHASPDKTGDLQRILYRRLGLPILKRTPKSKQPSTDKYVLEDLEKKTGHPIFDAIMRYRSFSGGVKTIESYIDFADEDLLIHPHIHPYRADTGREACRDPNLQNVSKDTTLRTRHPIPARRCFRPKIGYVNYHIDFAGIEWRLLVHFSQDPVLMKMVRDGVDGHAVAAEIFYRKRFLRAKGKKRKSLRDAAKNGNFCIGFGGGFKKLATTVGLPFGKAEKRYKIYRERFTGLATLNKKDSREVRQTGCVRTAFNRLLYVPSDKPYAGTNYRVQGTAAGILKRSQNRVDRYLIDATGDEVGIILPIHDELVIEVPKERCDDFEGDCLPEIRKLMLDFPQISVPLEIDVDVSKRRWIEVEAVDVPWKKN